MEEGALTTNGSTLVNSWKKSLAAAGERGTETRAVERVAMEEGALTTNCWIIGVSSFSFSSSSSELTSSMSTGPAIRGLPMDLEIASISGEVVAIKFVFVTVNTGETEVGGFDFVEMGAKPSSSLLPER